MSRPQRASPATAPAVTAGPHICGQPRVEQHTVTDEPDTDKGWRDAEQFWGGA
jgi:hypothetical protein